MSLTYWIPFHRQYRLSPGRQGNTIGSPAFPSPQCYLSGQLPLVCRCLRGDRAFAAAGSAYIELGNAAWGLTLVAVEFGYILLYRTGWKISMASLLANVSVALLLAGIGVLFYKDVLLPRQIIGIILCLAGVFFLRP